MSIFTDMSKNFREFVKTHKVDTGMILHKDPSPILSADILLSTEKRQQSLSEIRHLLNLPDDEFARVFQSVTENFAEFVQNLPETERSYYAGTGGMLDHALERASLSLFLCRTYLLPQDSTLSSVSASEMLWVYALYTAALVYDIGRIPTSHIVTLTDSKGRTLRSWLPYRGPMTAEKASHYVYGFSEEHFDHMRWQVTAMLARQILPEEGFNWIASDQHVLESWLGLLNDDHRQVSPLLSIVLLVEGLLQEGFYTGKKVFRNDLSPQSILMINKIAKDRKEAAEKQKEIKEKKDQKETDRLDKSKDSGKEKEKKDPKVSQDELAQKIDKIKQSKQSLFGISSIAQDTKLPQSLDSQKSASAYPIGHSNKEVISKFLDWMKQNETQNKASNGIFATEKGAVVDQKVIEKFIADGQMSSVTVEKVKQALVEANLANPVDYMAVIAGQQTGRISAALQFSNPFLVFYTGIPPLGLNGIMAAVVPPVQAAARVQTVQTAPEVYEQQQQQQHKIEQQAQSQTPSSRTSR